MSLLIALCVLLAGSAATPAQPRTARGFVSGDVSFCDLVSEPSRYSGRQVRVRAVYRYGFEWAQLYSLHCSDSPKVWVDVSDSYVHDTPRSIRRRLEGGGPEGRTVGVVAVGQIHDGGFGPSGSFPLEFVIDRVESARVLADASPVAEALSTSERRRVEEFEAGKQ